MRKLLISLVLLLLPQTATGQQGTGILSGRVLDVANGSPIGFASIVVENRQLVNNSPARSQAWRHWR